MGTLGVKPDLEFLNDVARDLGSTARTLQGKGFVELAAEAAELQRKLLAMKRQRELTDGGVA